MSRIPALACFLLAATVTAHPMIEKGHRYGVTFQHAVADSGTVTFLMTVTDKVTGEAVSVPPIVAPAGEWTRSSAASRTVTFNISVFGNPDGRATVAVRAMRAGVQVDAIVVTHEAPTRLIAADDGIAKVSNPARR